MTSHPIQLFTVCMTNKKKRNFGFYPFRTVNKYIFDLAVGARNNRDPGCH